MSEARPRSYRFNFLSGFVDPVVSEFDWALSEAAERLIDLVRDLDTGGVRNAPEPAGISIAWLVKHMTWAECRWVRTITGTPFPADLDERLRGGSPETLAVIDFDITPVELCDLVREGRYGYSRPAMMMLADIDKESDTPRGPNTIRKVLMHLVWHWTYHTGQVGLLRDFCGGGYSWSFEENDSV